MLGAWVMTLTVRNKVLTTGRACMCGDLGKGRQAWGPWGGEAGVGAAGRARRRGDHGGLVWSQHSVSQGSLVPILRKQYHENMV